MATTITVPALGAVDADVRTLATQAAADVNALQAGTTVTGVNGVTMPAGGALTVGSVLRATGVAAAAYGAVNLASSDAVTGLLPTANQAPGTAAQFAVTNAGATAKADVAMSGDATMVSTGVVTVAKVNGATYPAAGALTTGTVPRVTGASAVEYGALDLANASAVTGVLPTGNLAAATAAAKGAVTLVQQMGLVRSARGVVLTNQANLAAFVVASDDNVTYIEGDRVLLAGQTTAAEDGLYTVGAVGGGTAALTRATDYATGSIQPAGLQVHINEGTVFNHTIWFASLAGMNTVGTSAPEFFPRRYVRITTAMAGTPGVKALSAEWILDATTSSATPTVVTPGTQGFLSIGALTPGDGDGSFTVTSTANETSTLQIVIEN